MQEREKEKREEEFRSIKLSNLIQKMIDWSIQDILAIYTFAMLV